LGTERSGFALLWVVLGLELGGFDEAALALDFAPEFFLGRQVAHVFRGEELLAAFQHRILRHYLVLFRAEDEADGRVILRSAAKVIEHPHIHVELADVLMGELADLEVDQNEALEEVVVENEVDVEMLGFRGDAVLAGDESEALASSSRNGWSLSMIAASRSDS